MQYEVSPEQKRNYTPEPGDWFVDGDGDVHLVTDDGVLCFEKGTSPWMREMSLSALMEAGHVVRVLQPGETITFTA